MIDFLTVHAGDILARASGVIVQNKAACAYEQLCNLTINMFESALPRFFELIHEYTSSSLDVRKCCLYLLDEPGSQLWTIDSEHHTIIRDLSSISTSVLGQAVASGETVVQILTAETSERQHFKPYVIASPVICSTTRKVLAIIEWVTIRYFMIVEVEIIIVT